MLLRLLLLIRLLTLPSPVPGKFVNDFTGTLSPSARNELESEVQKVRVATTAQLAVVTVGTLEGLTIEEYANKLFRQWGIGERETNNGVLFLIAPNERRMRIEVGYGLESLLTDSLCGEIRDVSIIPSFKEGRMEEGIVNGTKELAKILLKYPDAARGIPGSAPSFVMTPRRSALFWAAIAGGLALVLFIFGMIATRRRNYSSLGFMVGTILLLGTALYATWTLLNLPSIQRPLGFNISMLGGTLLAFLYNTRRYLRFGPRRCRKCAGSLQLLGEQQDDSRLSETQKLEEQIGSVDYDVWYCPACLTQDVERYTKTFSGFGDCPKCKNRTFKETRTTVVAATTSSTGLARIDGECVSCNHRTSKTVTIARISSSSSSSSGGSGGGGGSFGGGSSGGGGASGSW